ncbi:MAG: hypothetical protein SFU85_12705 [Candidatus Methylacidiphilales bacterium]|nr:hypothetical protein [Candidatus Methylacidiphilales bacterium]
MKTWLAITAGLLLACLEQTGRAQETGPERSLKSRTSSGLETELAKAEESLALARTEADFFHQKWADLRIRTEALGLEALTGNEKALQDKIARLAGELYRSEKTRLQMEQSIADLIRTAKGLNQAGPLEKAQRRAEYEVAVREASRFLGGQPAQDRIQIAANLQSGFVAAFDDDMDVAIANFGRAQDARIGMPFRILRDGRVIGRCKLIEVREYLSAALVEGVIEKETVRPGDRLLLETVK